MKARKYTYIQLLLMCLWHQGANTQELNLFQDLENTEVSQETNRRPQNSQVGGSEPPFTLLGTSRFGDRYITSLKARDGKAVKVVWKENTTVEIEGYRGYAVADVGVRTTTLNYPDTERCIENISKGVKCNGIYVLLSLSTRQPLSQSNSSSIDEATMKDSSSAEDSIEIETTEDGARMFLNPFSGELQELPQLSPQEQAARDERRARRAEQFRNFEIVRISDDEIPEGMQRIRTPFGDRLEPNGTSED